MFKIHTIFAWLSWVLLICLSNAPSAQEPVAIRVRADLPGAQIQETALGLSYEASMLLPRENGEHYFRPGNEPLVRLFKTLGVRNLRIGGNSVDSPNFPVPSEADVRSFFEFAKAAGVKVIYSVRLQDGDPQYAARIARVIAECHGGTLDYFAIGNEPSYYKDYAVYAPKWTALRDAIVGEFPGARFCGPDENPSPELNQKMIRDFGDEAGRLAMITQHSYPLGCSYENPSVAWTGGDVSQLRPVDAAEGRRNMLSPGVWDTYAEVHAKMTRGMEGSGLPLRLTETNSFWFSGLEGASDRFASALWGVDYLYWWVSHGALGLDFHTGDRTGGIVTLPCRYAAFVTAPGGEGYTVRPLGYGMKLFAMGGHGRLLPVEWPAAQGQSAGHAPEAGTLVAYAAREGDRVRVTLVNRAYGPDSTAREVRIELAGVDAAWAARGIFLTAPDSDIAAETGLSLGGAPIREDGSWQGEWTPMESREGGVEFGMPPASAAVVELELLP